MYQFVNYMGPCSVKSQSLLHSICARASPTEGNLRLYLNLVAEEARGGSGIEIGNDADDTVDTLMQSAPTNRPQRHRGEA